MRFLAAAVALLLVVVVTACEPTIILDATVDLNIPLCPTSDSVYRSVPFVPLGCPTPTSVTTSTP